MKTKVSVIQMTSGPDVEKNLAVVERLVTEAARDGAKVIVVPECFAYLGPRRGKLAMAEPLPDGGPILTRMRRAREDHERGARARRVLRERERPREVEECMRASRRERAPCDRSIGRFISSTWICPTATKLEESATVEPGQEIVVTDTAFGKLGLSVCYDVRFPELYRAPRRFAARISDAVPGSVHAHDGQGFTGTLLLRARAIEAQFVRARGRADGPSSRRASQLRSRPDRRPVGRGARAECGEGEGFASAWIDDDRRHAHPREPAEPEAPRALRRHGIDRAAELGGEVARLFFGERADDLARAAIRADGAHLPALGPLVRVPKNACVPTSKPTMSASCERSCGARESARSRRAARPRPT